MTTDMKRIEDLINTARRAAQDYDNNATYDDDAAQAAYRAFNALADAVTALLRLVASAQAAQDAAQDAEDDEAWAAAALERIVAMSKARKAQVPTGVVEDDDNDDLLVSPVVLADDDEEWEREALQATIARNKARKATVADEDDTEDAAEDDNDPLAEDRRDPLWQEAEAALTATAYVLLDQQDEEWKSKVFLYWGEGYESVAEYRSVGAAYQAAIERRLTRYVITVDRLPDVPLRLAWLLKRVRNAQKEAAEALRRYGSTCYFYDAGQIDQDEVDEAAEACATAERFVLMAYRDYAETCRHMGVDPVSLEAIKEGGEA